jgi:N-carbamoylputrescine amidase
VFSVFVKSHYTLFNLCFFVDALLDLGLCNPAAFFGARAAVGGDCQGRNIKIEESDKPDAIFKASARLDKLTPAEGVGAMAVISVAATQMSCVWDRGANIGTAQALVRRAADDGAQIVLLQELFETPYFCPEQKAEHFALARPFANNETIRLFADLARELEVVLPISFFERDKNAHYNTVAVIDADGEILGRYRKGHIPDGPGYQEKFYFNPGDTGFKVWPTRYGNIGVAVCWDQWFSEAARVMALQGADILLYPTAIGCHPMAPDYDSQPTWRRAMQGHAACNALPVVASNRIGVEDWDDLSMTFYGSSFVADQHGELVAQAGRVGEDVVTASFDFAALRAERASWGFFRDRRLEHYEPLLSHAGNGGGLSIGSKIN